MKNVIAIAAALAAIVCFASAEAQAQTTLHPQGFPYPGGGYSSGFGNLGFTFQPQREQPPYFAKFPPVYYSHAVKRPYGVSPYAAPAGVVPVELTHPLPATNPVIIENPHVKKPMSDVKSESIVPTEVIAQDEKVTGWRTNPFYQSNRLVLN